MTSARDLIMGTGAPGFSFNTVGDTILGQILTEPKAVQVKKFGTEELDFWPSGDPKMQTVFQVQTAWRNYEGINTPDRTSPDSGVRTIYVKGKHFEKAVRTAVLMARASWLDIGGWFQATYTGDDMQSKAPMKPKLFDVKYQAAPTQAAQAVMGQPQSVDYTGRRDPGPVNPGPYGYPAPQPPQPAWQQAGWNPGQTQGQIAVPSHHGQPDSIPAWATPAEAGWPNQGVSAPPAPSSAPPAPALSTLDLIRQGQTDGSGSGQVEPAF